MPPSWGTSFRRSPWQGGWGASFLGPPSGGGVAVSQHALRQTPPVDRITDTSKNITLATASLRPVMKVHNLSHKLLFPHKVNIHLLAGVTISLMNTIYSPAFN